MRLIRGLSILSAVFAFGLLPATAGAVTIQTQTYSGPFPATVSGLLPSQDTVLEWTVTLPASGNFMATTTSYASGGFAPNLTLFSSSGVELDGSQPTGTVDPTTGTTNDATLSPLANSLAAGTYILTLSDWNVTQSITATNLSDGFVNYGDGKNFVDPNGVVRTGNFSVDLAFSPAGSAVPEPTTLLFTAPVIGGLFYFRRKLATSK